MNYREYKDDDTIRITGCQGRLFCHFGTVRLNSDVQLGVECVFIGTVTEQGQIIHTETL